LTDSVDGRLAAEDEEISPPQPDVQVCVFPFRFDGFGRGWKTGVDEVVAPPVHEVGGGGMGLVDPTMRTRGGRSGMLLFRTRMRWMRKAHGVGAAVSGVWSASCGSWVLSAVDEI
jgi:hypothetical protein